MGQVSVNESDSEYQWVPDTVPDTDGYTSGSGDDSGSGFEDSGSGDELTQDTDGYTSGSGYDSLLQHWAQVSVNESDSEYQWVPDTVPDTDGYTSGSGESGSGESGSGFE